MLFLDVCICTLLLYYRSLYFTSSMVSGPAMKWRFQIAQNFISFATSLVHIMLLHSAGPLKRQGHTLLKQFWTYTLFNYHKVKIYKLPNWKIKTHKLQKNKIKIKAHKKYFYKICINRLILFFLLFSLILQLISSIVIHQFWKMLNENIFKTFNIFKTGVLKWVE